MICRDDIELRCIFCSDDMSQFMPRLKEIVTKEELSMALNSFSIPSTSEEIDKLWLMYDMNDCTALVNKHFVIYPQV